MTAKETQSMVAHKQILDAYFSLPLSVRAQIEPTMEKAIGLNMAALKQYSEPVRKKITNAVNHAGISKHYFTEERIL